MLDGVGLWSGGETIDTGTARQVHAFAEFASLNCKLASVTI